MALRETTVHCEDGVRKIEEVAKLLCQGLENTSAVVKRLLCAQGEGNGKYIAALEVCACRALLVCETAHENNKRTTGDFRGVVNDLARAVLGLDHGQPESHLRQLLPDRFAETEHQEKDGVATPEEVLVSDVVLLHAREIPDTEVPRVRDAGVLDGHPVRASEYHVLEV